MNETFSLKRFLNIVCSDCRNAWHRFGLSMLVSISVILIIWMIHVSTNAGGYVDANARWVVIYFIVMILVTLSPSKIYRSCNIPNHGLAFATCPVSKLEKFLSMLLVCLVIVPAVSIAGCLLLDTLLTLLPFGPFKDFIYNHEPVNFSIRIGSVVCMSLPVILLNTARDVSVFIFFNTVFKSKKFLKTALSLIAFCIVFFVVAANLHTADTELWDSLSFDFWHNAYMIISALITAVSLAGTWLRLKKMKY